jgi:hypothetical protein
VSAQPLPLLDVSQLGVLVRLLDPLVSFTFVR